MILEVTVNGGATRIVTSNADLFVLHPFRGVGIMTPGAFFLD